MKLTVQPGDTLSHLTREALKKGGAAKPGQDLSFSSLLNRIQTVAKTNDIDNPDLIFPGQVIDFAPIIGRKPGMTQAISEPAPSRAEGSMTKPQQVSAVSDAGASNTAHRVLERTLDRAVARGYLPQADLPEARRRILDMAKEHRFMPDDFARVALIESDGFNPKASNGNCHGVIQFCDGPDRGAASVGFGKNPQEILSMSVLEQLDLVDKYFNDTQLKSYMPASLDALYLTVLYPAARDERQMHRALPIPGPQASVLHVGGLSTNPITRASIRKGLVENASVRLNQFALEKARADVARAKQQEEFAAAAQTLSSLKPSGEVASYFPATQFTAALNRPTADFFATRERL